MTTIHTYRDRNGYLWVAHATGGGLGCYAKRSGEVDAILAAKIALEWALCRGSEPIIVPQSEARRGVGYYLVDTGPSLPDLGGVEVMRVSFRCWSCGDEIPRPVDRARTADQQVDAFFEWLGCDEEESEDA